MPDCPDCGHPLELEEWRAGACRHCGRRLVSEPGAAASGSPQGAAEDVLQNVNTIEGTVVVDPAIAASGGADQGGRPTTAEIERTLDTARVEGAAANTGDTDTERYLPTIEASAASQDPATVIDRTWDATDLQGGNPLVTIKSQSSVSLTHSSVSVQPRALRSADESAQLPTDYELIDKLGEGGMGLVYLARQASINRVVALKMLKSGAVGTPEQRVKFLSEAVVTGDLDHPNIVPIYDLGTSQEGTLFYSMKRVQGTPWLHVIGQKSVQENVEILMKVADAVAFAHSRGVIHRDLKPENVMLGDFGEVLLLDWGLAMPTAGFEKSDSVTHTHSVGGTPAYMAPEMATGPVEQVGPAADIYLLGAILYDIVTGQPPHTGANVMLCLAAAARNEIQPTNKSGELLEIALTAMATRPEDRYASVREFQDAVRAYLSHTESIALAVRAEQELLKAQGSDDYQDYARSLFAFQEAHALWSGNERAGRGRSAAAAAYAQSALRKGDFDLGASLLDASDPTHQPLLKRVRDAQQDRDQRQQRLRRLRRAVRVGLVLFFIVITGASLWIWHERNKAIDAERVAQTQRRVAVEQKQKADQAREDEAAARSVAEAERVKADQARVQAETAEGIAVQEREKAVEAKEEADRQRDKAEYQAYVALIGLAAAQVDENAFDTARQLLEQCPPRLRHWEWGRLMHLCQLSVRDYPAPSPIETLTLTPDGGLLVGGWNGLAQILSGEKGVPRRSFPQAPLSFVYASAVSPDGRLAALGASDREQGFLTLWDTRSGQLVRRFEGHADSVVSLAFSGDGRRLLSGSFDQTAKLWNVETGALQRTLAGHRGWVWCAAFCYRSDADHQPLVEQQVVTASQDGFAIVWRLDRPAGAADEKAPPFRGHEGPVYTAAFSPDGRRVVTGGYDKRVLIWNPEQLHEFEFERVIFNESLPPERQAESLPVAPPRFIALEGHLAAVRSVAFDRSGERIVSGGHDNTVRLWDAATGRRLKTLRGHGSWVRACQFGVDGKSVFSAGYDHQVKRWDVENYEEIRRVPRGRVLEGHAGDILGTTFSGDGKYILTAGRDRTARMWETASAQEVLRLEEGHQFLTSRAAFFPGGQFLATAAVDNTVRVWDVAAGTELLRLPDTGRSAALAVDPRGSWLLTGSSSHALRVWELVLGPQPEGAVMWRAELRAELTGHTAPLTALAFAADGETLYSGDAGGLGLLWDTSEMTRVRRLRRLEGHSARITAAAFLPDGQRLLTASGDGTVGQWTVATGEERRDLVLRHKQGASVTSLALAADGTTAVTSCDDGRVRVWDVERAEIQRELVTPRWEVARAEAPDAGSASPPVERAPVVQSVAIAPDGRLATTVCADEQLVRLWDLPTGQEIRFGQDGKVQRPFLDFRGRSLLWSAVFSPDGTQLVTVGGDMAQLWNVSRTIPPTHETQVFLPHGSIAFASFSPDGHYVVTASWDASARIWNTRTGKAEVKLVGHTGAVNSAVFSPDGRCVLTASSDGTAAVWEARTGQCVQVLRGHRDAVQSAAFSPDGRRIVTASHDATARIWNAATGQVEGVLEGHRYRVLCAAFSADDRYVLTGGEDHTAILWNATNSLPRLVLAGHTAAVTSVALSPDGKRALTGSDDFTAKLWDTETLPDESTVRQATDRGPLPPQAKEILTLKGHTRQVTSVAFSPDGVLALTGSRDGTAILWLAAPLH